MVTTPDNVGPRQRDHPYDNLDVDSGAIWARTDEERGRIRDDYLDWLDAGRPAIWPPKSDLPAEYRVRGQKAPVAPRNRRPAGTNYIARMDPSDYDDVEDPEGESVPVPDGPGASIRPKVGAGATPRVPEPAPESSEAQARRWSREHDLPKHNRWRPSQTYQGRRQRYLLAKAKALGITVASAAQKFPPRGPRGPKPPQEDPE